jgi:adenylate kinase family enzyme
MSETDPARIVVIGAPGSGKTTLALHLAERLGIEHVELDALFHGPGWEPVGDVVFQERLREVAARPRWVVDGAYLRHTAPSIWPRADLTLWLDVPLRVLLSQLVMRSAGRVVRRTRLWHGNRETLRRLLSRESIVVYAVTFHRRLRRELPERFAAQQIAPGVVVRLRSRRAIARWRATVLRT